MKPLSDYLCEDLILFINDSKQEEVLDTLVSSVSSFHKLPNPEKFKKAILDREKLVSTGIGMGVAIPHAKMTDYDTFFIAVAILTKGVNWNAIDGAPVRLVFMIGGPDDKQTEYLQILSHLTHLMKNEEIRKKMLTLNSKEAILQLFKTNA